MILEMITPRDEEFLLSMTINEALSSSYNYAMIESFLLA